MVQLKYRIHFTLFSAKLFPFASTFFFQRYLQYIPFMLRTNLFLTKKLPFSTHWPKDKKVSLIWSSSCSQTASTSRSDLVTAKRSLSCPGRPPLVLFCPFLIKVNELEELGPGFSLPPARPQPLRSSSGTEWRGHIWPICYCMEHTTLTL